MTKSKYWGKRDKPYTSEKRPPVRARDRTDGHYYLIDEKILYRWKKSQKKYELVFKCKHCKEETYGNVSYNAKGFKICADCDAIEVEKRIAEELKIKAEAEVVEAEAKAEVEAEVEAES